MITKETRAESLNELDKTKRYEEIRYALKNEINGLTARELAKKLGSEERNYVAPRLTELTRKNEIKVISKRYDKKTRRIIAIIIMIVIVAMVATSVIPSTYNKSLSFAPVALANSSQSVRFKYITSVDFTIGKIFKLLLSN